MEQVERENIELGDDVSDTSSSSSSQLCLCRICHEEEEMGGNTMEAPCGCSGTLKFAHRECIQRWCDEKGNSICEICLQIFRPDYNLPPKACQLIDVMVTIRGSLEVPRMNYDPRTATSDGNELNVDDPECSPSANRGIFCRPLAIIVTTLLLIWQIVTAITREGHYSFALTTVLVLRACGILLPFYLIMRSVSAIQHSDGQHGQRVEVIARVEENLEIQHIVEIHP